MMIGISINAIYNVHFYYYVTQIDMQCSMRGFEYVLPLLTRERILSPAYNFYNFNEFSEFGNFKELYELYNDNIYQIFIIQCRVIYF